MHAFVMNDFDTPQDIFPFFPFSSGEKKRHGLKGHVLCNCTILCTRTYSENYMSSSLPCEWWRRTAWTRLLCIVLLCPLLLLLGPAVIQSVEAVPRTRPSHHARGHRREQPRGFPPCASAILRQRSEAGSLLLSSSASSSSSVSSAAAAPPFSDAPARIAHLQAQRAALDRVYIMHYTKTPSRLEKTSARLSEHGLLDKLAVAVTGFDKEELSRETVDCFFAKDDSWPTLRPGEQSLGVKFYSALYDIVMRSSDIRTISNTALILEDDIWMDDSSFDEYVGNLLQVLPPNFDVVHLGDCLGYKDMWRATFVASGLSKPVSEHGGARLFEATNVPCSHAMLVSRLRALKLLRHALRHDEAAGPAH